MTAIYARFFHLTPLPDQGMRVVTTWREGEATARQTVERAADDAALLSRTLETVEPDPIADLAARHWSLCECIRLGIAVFGDDPAAANEATEQARHGAG